MHFGIYSYIITTLLFAGGAVLIEYMAAGRTLWRFRRVVWCMGIIAIVATSAGESVALAWRLWEYHPERTFQIYFLGAALETYLFAFLVSVAIASATLYWTYCEDRGRSIINSTYSNVAERLEKLFKRPKSKTPNPS
jgi:lycopene cyclase domain-containing protein